MITIKKERELISTSPVVASSVITLPAGMNVASLKKAITSTSNQITTENWPGDSNLSVTFPPSQTGSRKGANFSETMKKLFVDAGTIFQINARIDKSSPINADHNELRIRALLVYMDTASMADPVLRCSNHFIQDQQQNPEKAGHVLWSEDEDAYYEMDGVSGRFSVTVPFGHCQPGTDFVHHRFKFTCLGSCVGGINRRPILINFTLENGEGNVLGRQSFPVRICSCPHRDMKIEERRLTPTKNPSPLKRSNCVLNNEIPRDQGVYLVPVFGYENFKALEKFAQFLDSQSGALEDPAMAEKRKELLHEYNFKSVVRAANGHATSGHTSNDTMQEPKPKSAKKVKKSLLLPNRTGPVARILDLSGMPEKVEVNVDLGVVKVEERGSSPDELMIIK